MSGYVNADGSGLVGGLAAGGIGQALQVDGAGNLKTTVGSGVGVDGGNGSGFVAETLYLFNNGGPGNNNFDRKRELQGKGITFYTITGGASVSSTSLTLAAASGLLPGTPLLLVGGGYTETVYVSGSYTVGSTTIPLQTGIVYAGHTGAFWDVYAPQGPQLGGLLATGIDAVANVIIDPNAGNYYIVRSASQDGCVGSNIPLCSPALYNGSTLDRVNGVNGALSTQDWVRQLLWQGHAYCAHSGLQSSAAGTNDYALSIFNPTASGKNIMLYSLHIAASGTMIAKIKATSSDPAYASAATVSNQRAGSGASAIASNCTCATSNTSNSGPYIQSEISSGPTELLPNNQVLLLPAGSNNGITLFLETVASGTYSITAHYIEY
ncbi:hypothetical protein ccbrp13_21740 [Ktedonobacteria bacterium brp13]|nr:hypothetical protein ccbrp13_21740 [Ktedonobacteria bacterium brp13]